MTSSELAQSLSTHRTRRQLFRDCGVGTGKAALGGLLGATTAAAGQPPQPSHSQPPAKAVIHLFMAGAPSQLEMWDHKPVLAKHDGNPIPPEVIDGQRYAFISPDAAAMGPQLRFRQVSDAGTGGLWASEAIPHTAAMADDLCVIRSCQTDQFNHAPAQIFFNTGFAQPGRPSVGSWTTYGLGTETDDLPAFVVMSTGGNVSGGAANWSSGFLPTTHSGVLLRKSGDPILNVSSPPGIDARRQADSLDLIGRLNRERLATDGDAEIATRIAAYEMAYRLQTSAPELMDLSGETKATLESYGIADLNKPSFARGCLLARRMVERGVRYINIYHGSWDAHTNVEGSTRRMCAATDRGCAALVADLKQRGLLDQTLVVWGGEFGRTPMVESNAALGRSLGRDHHPQAFTMWMAGGGIKGGTVYGATDELGFNAVEKPVHVHDIQATMLHQLGLNHERLTYHHQGREFRLTDVHGHVLHDILA